MLYRLCSPSWPAVRLWTVKPGRVTNQTDLKIEPAAKHHLELALQPRPNPSHPSSLTPDMSYKVAGARIRLRCLV